MKNFKLNRFWQVVITFLVIYALVHWGIPMASRKISGLPFPLSVPGALVFIYMTLTLVALFMHVTYSDAGLQEFMNPVYQFLRGEYGHWPRALLLGALPLVVGWQVYAMTAPRAQLPLSLRIQHPASSFPKRLENVKNPFDTVSDADLDTFIDQAKVGQVTLIPQVMPDVNAWREEHSDADPQAFIATESMAKFLQQIKNGKVDRNLARAAWRDKTLFEGRALYAMNCRACHGDSVGGDGPMANGFKLRPINFTDNGTLETIVAGYTFWRVTNGGPGLPTEATPWDSAMPEWKLSLTEEQRWRIILAEYDLAEKTPRIREGSE